MSLEDDVRAMIDESLKLTISMAANPSGLAGIDAPTMLRQIVVPALRTLEQGVLRVAKAVDEMKA